jgi:hypothetical protein
METLTDVVLSFAPIALFYRTAADQRGGVSLFRGKAVAILKSLLPFCAREAQDVFIAIRP